VAALSELWHGSAYFFACITDRNVAFLKIMMSPAGPCELVPDVIDTVPLPLVVALFAVANEMSPE
jgi:hypothetical protein